jgi:hypothetical protein
MQLIAANVAAGAQFFLNYNIAAATNAAITNANSSWRNSAMTNGLFTTQIAGSRAVADTSTEEAEQRQLPLFDEFGGKQCRSFSAPATGLRKLRQTQAQYIENTCIDSAFQFGWKGERADALQHGLLHRMGGLTSNQRMVEGKSSLICR